MMMMMMVMMCDSQLKSPGLVTMADGKNRTLYMSTVQSIETATKPNLKKTLQGTVPYDSCQHYLYVLLTYFC